MHRIHHRPVVEILPQQLQRSWSEAGSDLCFPPILSSIGPGASCAITIQMLVLKTASAQHISRQLGTSSSTQAVSVCSVPGDEGNTFVEGRSETFPGFAFWTTSHHPRDAGCEQTAESACQAGVPTLRPCRAIASSNQSGKSLQLLYSSGIRN